MQHGESFIHASICTCSLRALLPAHERWLQSCCAPVGSFYRLLVRLSFLKEFHASQPTSGWAFVASFCCTHADLLLDKTVLLLPPDSSPAQAPDQVLQVRYRPAGMRGLCPIKIAIYRGLHSTHLRPCFCDTLMDVEVLGRVRPVALSSL